MRQEDSSEPFRALPSRSVDDMIRYSGRKAYREKSIQRRREILDAALRIAAKEGVKGIKHRPVAQEADVPLASTTYYFRDIEELTHDAFVHFVESNKLHLDQFYGRLTDAVSEGIRNGELYTLTGRHRLADHISRMVSDYLANRFRFHKLDLQIEQVFFVEASRSCRLEALARTYRASWSQGLELVLDRLGTPHPKRDAALVINVASGMGFDGLLYNDQFNPDYLHDSIARIFRWLVDPDGPGGNASLDKNGFSTKS